MAIPGERATLVTSAPSNAALNELSGVFKHVLSEHGEAFALVKRLSMRLDREGCGQLGTTLAGEACSHSRGEMAQGYAALKAIVQKQHLLESEARPSDLADAMAALDAINPGSPEWGPTFLQVSELLEAHLHAAEDSLFAV